LKVLILAGGFGTRLSEETQDKPKPMVRLNGKPILWHVMSIYASQGITDFVVACGYKKEIIFEYLSNEFIESWSVDPVDTGETALTGGRISQVMDKYPGERLGVTYGDGLGNVNISKLLAFHNNQQTFVTLTAVRPPARFGSVQIKDGFVEHFGEKNQADEGWINGGFFILEPETRKYIWDLNEAFEAHVLPRLVVENQLSAFQHYGFWQPMDTLRERNELDQLARADTQPWLDVIPSGAIEPNDSFLH
jgi:glucose-1-phosphate cytidylyltransferase